jgi:serine/threonine protein kinase
VYKGIDQSTGGVVAIKEVSLEGVSADDLQSEIDLLKNLNHRNVVQYLGTFKARALRAAHCAPRAPPAGSR